VKSQAIVLFIHGGYWQALDPSFFSHMARGLNLRGVPVAVAGYDLCPQVEVGHIVWELQQAAAAIWRRYNLPVVAAGHSAGGQLSACLLATDWSNVDAKLPDHVVPAAYGISGLYNLKPLTETSLNKALGLTTGRRRARKPAVLAGAVRARHGRGRRRGRRAPNTSSRAAG
jgi:arylformamidase